VRVRAVIAVAAAISGGILIPAAAEAPAATHATHHAVLRVGTYHHIKGQFSNLQAAVDHAKTGDWILVGPGDYKTPHSYAPKADRTRPAGVLVTTNKVKIRGMNRNKVIIDGTKSGPPCSTATKDQVFGPKVAGGRVGRNGIMPYKANDTRVDNLTTCNFLNGEAGDNGNEIWWNGGAGSGKVGAHGYWGDYLTATDTYFHDESTVPQYGIFSSNWNGGIWNYTYASGFNDSGYYIGACHQVCNQVLNHGWAEYSALGYSGSNSGGSLIVKNSEFDNNEDGFDTNSQNGDNPPPQNGACPNGKISPITHTHSCWVFMHNYVHDNNDPNVPVAGSAAAGPLGTGMSISGGRNDTIMDNTFKNNKAWGVIFVPYPDSGPPCTGGTSEGGQCIYDEFGDALLHNKFKNNGGFGNNTNGDFGATNLETDETDCYHGNKEIGGGTVTSSPSNAESMYPKCTGKNVPPDSNPAFLQEVACDANISLFGTPPGASCTPGDHYPRQTKVKMHPLPGAKPKGHLPAIENPASAKLKTMPNPCAGVPANPWCPHNSSSGGHHGYFRAMSATRTAAYARPTLWARLELIRR
jgi:hypothetical protein